MIPMLVLLFISAIVSEINSIQISNMASEAHQAAGSMISMITGTLPIAFTFCLAGILEASVSYSLSKKNYTQCGNYLHKTLMVNTMAFIPVAILIFYSQILFESVTENIESSRIASSYLKIALPGLFF
jgi:Na+-driven multidrug efflux pump